MPAAETSAAPDTPTPLGPFRRVAQVGDWVTVSGSAGVDLTAETRT